MIPEFDRLSNPEIELMLKAPFLVCVLIAGADDNIDKKEIKKAIQLAEMKKGKTTSRIIELYKTVAEDFEDKFMVVMQSLPSTAAKRNPIITEELAKLNEILPRLDKSFAPNYYQCLKNIALRIAQSSGGILGLNKMADEEAELVGLSMIKNPATA
ncbi:MAG TPA: hypothetical protein VFE57_04975 [Cyclobacteriaceae bacterium]|jgi:hypothetical protein|nr:hypothetical protein [Cyclobacteriaceae bacterium]